MERIKNDSDVPMSETPAIAMFDLKDGNGIRLYRGHISEMDGRRWLVLGSKGSMGSMAATRIDLQHAVFVADNVTDQFIIGLKPEKWLETEQVE